MFGGDGGERWHIEEYLLYIALMISAHTKYDSNKHDTNPVQTLLHFQRSLGQIGFQQKLEVISSQNVEGKTASLL